VEERRAGSVGSNVFDMAYYEDEKDLVLPDPLPEELLTRLREAWNRGIASGLTVPVDRVEFRIEARRRLQILKGNAS
jgi:hypothetical protein